MTTTGVSSSSTLATVIQAARFLTGERDAAINASIPSAPSTPTGSNDRLDPVRQATQDARREAYAKAIGIDPAQFTLRLPAPVSVVRGVGPLSTPQRQTASDNEVSFALTVTQAETGLAALDALQHIGYSLYAATTARAAAIAQRPSSTNPPKRQAGQEEDPSEAPLLGTSDRKVIDTLVILVNQWAMDLISSLYDHASAAARSHSQSRSSGSASLYEIGSCDDPFARLHQIRSSASQILSAFARIVEVHVDVVIEAARAKRPAPDPPSRTQGADEEEPISNRVLRSCSASLFRLAFRVAFDTVPAGQQRQITPGSGTDVEASHVAHALLKMSLRRLTVLQCYAALSSVTARMQAGAPGNLGGSSHDANLTAAPVPPPPGVAAHASRLLSAQLLRPGGVRAMLSIMLLRPVAGSRAAGNPPPPPHGQQYQPQKDLTDSLLDHEVDPAPSTAKVQRVVTLLARPPPRFPLPHWLEAVVPQLIDVIIDAGAPLLYSIQIKPQTAGRSADQIHASSAVTAMQHLASQHPQVNDFVTQRLSFPFAPLPSSAPSKQAQLTTPTSVAQSLQTLLSLVTFGPPDPTYLHTVLDLGGHVAPLVALAGFLRQRTEQKSYDAVTSSSGPKVQEVGTSSPAAVVLDTTALLDALQIALSRWCSTRNIDRHEEILNFLGPQEGGALSLSSFKVNIDASALYSVWWFWHLTPEGQLTVRQTSPSDGINDETEALASILSSLSSNDKNDQSSLRVSSLKQPTPSPSDPVHLFLPTLQVVIHLLDQVQSVEQANPPIKPQSTFLDDLLKLLLMEFLRNQRSRRPNQSQQLAYSAVLLQAITTVLRRVSPALYTHHAISVLLFIDYALDWGNDTKGEPVDDQTPEVHLRPVVSAEEATSEAQESQTKAKEILSMGMRPAAASLLIELLYNNTSLSLDNTPLLSLVMDKFEALVKEQDRAKADACSRSGVTLLDPGADLEEEPLSRVLPTLRLILRARDSSEEVGLRFAARADHAQDTPQARTDKQYAEAMALIQDSSIPVRGHGLVLLTQLVAVDELGTKLVETSKEEKPKRPLVVMEDEKEKTESEQGSGDALASLSADQLARVLDVFLAALDEDDSYVYMNAIKGLAQLALLPDGGQVFRRLVDMYVRGTSPTSDAVASISRLPSKSSDTNKKTWTSYGSRKPTLNPSTHDKKPELQEPQTIPHTVNEVDRRLRVGETIGQVIQRLGQTMASKVSILVNPFFAFVRDIKIPTTLCVSTISLLGTLVEAAPTAIAFEGYGDELANMAIDLLTLEGARATFAQASSRTEGKPKVTGHAMVEEMSPEEDDDAVQLEDDPLSVDRSLPQLRRAAFLLLDLLLVGTVTQLDAQQEELTHKALEESQGSGLSSLRLPGGSILTPADAGTAQAKSISCRLLLSQPLIVRIKELAMFASTAEMDPVAQQLAVSCVDQADAIVTALVGA